MGYCEKSDKRLWRERQEEWIKDLKKKGFSWGKLLDYDFSNEWALGDHKERSPLCQIVWGKIIVDYLNQKYGKTDYKYSINRYYMKVWRDGEKSIRFLFDVMNNPNHNIGKEQGEYTYHHIGNYAPVPGIVPQKRSLQFVHRDKNERWDEMLEYMHDNWESIWPQTQNENSISFNEYINMTLQGMYIKDSKVETIKYIEQIKEKIKERNRQVVNRLKEITNKSII